MLRMSTCTIQPQKVLSHCPDIDREWTHEYEVSHDLWDFFLAANDFEVVADAGETQPARPGEACTINHPRNLKMSLFVCPSAVKLGTV